MSWKMRPKTICSFSVRMNRSATPLVSGSRTKAKLDAMRKNLSWFWKCSDMKRAAVVVTQQHPARGVGADGCEDLADGQRQRLGGGVTVAVLGDVPAETLGVPVFGDDEQRDVDVLDRRYDGAVGAPHDVRCIGGDRAVVVVGRTGPPSMRGEQPVLAHDPQHAGPADPDAVDHPQPGY